MKRYTLILFLISSVYSVAQTKVETKNIKLSFKPSKKIIKEKQGDYFLYFDATDYINSIDADSIFDSKEVFEKKNLLINKLNEYFESNDTLLVSVVIERKFNMRIEYFDSYKGYALENGNANIINIKTKKQEEEVISISTLVKNEKSGILTNGQKWIKGSSTSSYRIFTKDKKEILFETSGGSFYEDIK